MTPFLQLALLIATLLVATKLAGYLSTLAGQPSVLGELLVGLLIGPSVIDLLHLPLFSDHLLPEFVEHLAEIGVLLLMFVAGLELHFSELARNVRVSALAGLLGVVIPVGLGYSIGAAFGYSFELSLFLGLALGATSVSISAQTLIELRALRSRVGLGLLGAAVFDDILVILTLSAFLAILAGEAGLGAIIMIFLRILIFLLLSVAFGLWVLPVLVRRVARLPISQGVLTLALVTMLLYGFAAEVLGGMAAITGAFLAGLMFARSPEKDRLERGVTSVAYSFFVPIFFVNIGLTVNVRELDPTVGWLFLAITLAAIVGKLFGAAFGARLAQFSWRESFQLGAGMISRGEVGLILASVGVGQNVLTSGEFSAIVGMVLVTTLVTPPLLRALFARGQLAPATQAPELPVEKPKILDEEIS
ncbi:MAG TPA: cation:proton antiporter [Anaerolineales bacterium]|nr:cation:proton antiporter [Anaerolineales bacterium]